MYYVHTYLNDPSAKYWAVVFCMDLEDARVEKNRVWRDARPDEGYGVKIEAGYSILDCLHLIGVFQSWRGINHFIEYTRYLKDLLPYCSERLQTYLIEMLVRISIYRRMKLNLSELERKASEGH